MEGGLCMEGFMQTAKVVYIMSTSGNSSGCAQELALADVTHPRRWNYDTPLVHVDVNVKAANIE